MNIKILKSNGWKYDKVLKTWSHKQYDFTVSLTSYNNGLMRFWQIYKSNIYTQDLKERGLFVSQKQHKAKQEKERKLRQQYSIFTY